MGRKPRQDDGDQETLTRDEQLRLLMSTFTSTDLAQLLAGTEFADGGSIALLPAPSEPEDDWRSRADAYASTYPGADHWRRFCDIVAATGSIPFAAKHVGKSLLKVQQRRDRFPEFAAHTQAALDHFNSAVLERAAFVRAIDGVVEPVFNKGVIVGYIRRYSDALMTKLLEGNLPDKYKPKSLVENNNTFVLEGGLPEMPRTPAEIPAEVAKRLGMTIDNPPQPQQQADESAEPPALPAPPSE